MASALFVLGAAPTYAACQDQISQLQSRLEEAQLGQQQERQVRQKISQARDALRNNNQEECERIISSVNIRQRDRTAAAEQEQSELTITQPEPQVTVDQPTPDITITQPAPTVRVEQDRPDVNVEVPEPRIQSEGDRQAEVQIEEQPQPNVTYEQTGEAEIVVEEEGQQTGQMQGREGLTVSQITGMTATNQEGLELGQVENIARSSEDGSVYVVISSGGFFGLGDQRRVVPLSDIQLSEEAAVLDIETRAQLNSYENYNANRFEEVEGNTSLAELQSGTSGQQQR